MMLFLPPALSHCTLYLSPHLPQSPKQREVLSETLNPCASELIVGPSRLPPLRWSKRACVKPQACEMNPHEEERMRPVAGLRTKLPYTNEAMCHFSMYVHTFLALARHTHIQEHFWTQLHVDDTRKHTLSYASAHSAL